MCLLMFIGLNSVYRRAGQFDLTLPRQSLELDEQLDNHRAFQPDLITFNQSQCKGAQLKTTMGTAELDIKYTRE